MLQRLRKFLAKDSQFNEMISGSLLAMVHRAVGILLAYIFALIVTRMFGAGSWGDYSVALSITNIFCLVVKFGLDTANVKLSSEFISNEDRSALRVLQKTLAIFIVLVGIVLSIGLFFWAEWIATHLLEKPYLTPLLQMVSIIIVPRSLFDIFVQTIRGFKRLAWFAFFRFTAIFLFSLVLILVLAIFKIKFLNPFAIYGFGVIASLIFLLWRLRQEFTEFDLSKDQDTSSQIERIGLISLLSLSLPMFFASSMSLMIQWTDTLLLARFATQADVGIYNIATKVAAVSSISLIAVNASVASQFSILFSQNKIEEMGRLAQQMTTFLCLITFPIIVIILVFAKDILSVFGPEFVVAEYALIFITIGQIANVSAGSCNMLLLMGNGQKIFQSIMFFAMLFNLLTNLILIPRYGFLGAAIVQMVTFILWNSACIIAAYMRYGFYCGFNPFLVKTAIIKVFQKMH